MYVLFLFTNGAPRVPTAAALHASVDSASASRCAACGRDGHPLSRCYDITRVPVGDRKPILRGIGACYKCPGFPPKSSSSATTWWWESVNLLGNSPKGGIDENKVSLGAVSNEPRCTCCFSSQIRNLCLSTDNIRRNLCPDPGRWTVFVLTVVLVFVDVVSVGTVGNSDLAGVSEVRVCVPVVIMSESVRSRMVSRGWVTRASRKLDELCNVRDIDNLELRDAIEELDKRLETLDNAQSVVELELTVEQLEEDIIVASEFRDKARVPLMRATKMMAARLPARASSELDSVSVVSAAVEAKLPKLELPTFSGDVTEWTSFWDQFQAVVHASELPDITKFSYLRSLLKGEAKAAVQGLSLTAAHYRIACDLLRDRFGRPERIVFSHIQELLNITVPKYPNASVLWTLYDDLQAHIRSLAAMGITGEQYGVVLTPLILSRLPPDLRMEWAREGEQHESELKFLLDFLHRELGHRERSQTFSRDSSAAPGDKTLMEKHVPTAAALHASVDSASASRRAGVMDTPCLGVMTSQECPLVTGNLYYVV